MIEYDTLHATCRLRLRPFRVPQTARPGVHHGETHRIYIDILGGMPGTLVDTMGIFLPSFTFCGDLKSIDTADAEVSLDR